VPESAFQKRGAFCLNNLKIIGKLQKIISEKPYEYQAVSDLFEMARIVEQDDPKLAHSINKDLRNLIPQQVRNAKNDLNTREKFYFLNKRCYSLTLRWILTPICNI